MVPLITQIMLEKSVGGDHNVEIWPARNCAGIGVAGFGYRGIHCRSGVIEIGFSAAVDVIFRCVG